VSRRSNEDSKRVASEAAVAEWTLDQRSQDALAYINKTNGIVASNSIVELLQNADLLYRLLSSPGFGVDPELTTENSSDKLVTVSTVR
jgi:uncharacterized lipoprotein YajG